MNHATLRPKGQLTLPAEVRNALHISAGDGVNFTIESDGRVVLTGTKTIAADQAWFWTQEWQEGEREASEQVARGEVDRYESVDDFLDSLPEN
ncbi:MAG: AbrB/MazE/SpoVT family DNA-binding domain-containing protein [Nocardioidaceae bacterium]